MHVWVESDASVVGNSNPPVEYHCALHTPVERVVKAAIRQFSVPVSPYYMVVRVSKWFSSAQTTDDYDKFSTKAMAIETAINALPAEQKQSPTVISTEEGSASLIVHDVYTTTSSGQSGDFRTYSVFICTGQVDGASDEDTWRVHDNIDVISETPVDFTDETDASYGTPVTAGQIVTALYTIPQRMFLTVRLNNETITRMRHMNTTSVPYWESFHWYRPGVIVRHGTTKYQCIRKHMSLVHATDLSNDRWVQIAESTRTQHPANSAFLALETGSNEVIKTDTATGAKYEMKLVNPMNVQQLEMEWRDENNLPPYFPAETAHVMLSFDASESVAARIAPFKKYKDQAFLIELAQE